MMFSFQYTFLSHTNFFRNSLAVFPFMNPTTSETAYLGGIIIIVCIWSICMFCSIISVPGIVLSI